MRVIRVRGERSSESLFCFCMIPGGGTSCLSSDKSPRPALVLRRLCLGDARVRTWPRNGTDSWICSGQSQRSTRAPFTPGPTCVRCDVSVKAQCKQELLRSGPLNASLSRECFTCTSCCAPLPGRDWSGCHDDQ